MRKDRKALLGMALACASLLGACGSDDGGGEANGSGGGGNSSGSDGGGSEQTSTQTVSVRVISQLAEGESFAFSLGSQTAVVRESGNVVAFANALEKGSMYTVSQLSGPRTCTLSANRSGTIGTRDVTVNADCGAPAGTSTLSGELRGPISTQVTLRQGMEDLTVAVQPLAASIDDYNAQTFSFTTPARDGDSYEVKIQTQPENLICKVYKGATGVLPVAAGGLKVGCEHKFDHLSRGTEDSLFTYFESTDVVLGGAAEGIGGGVAYGEGRFVAFVSDAKLGGSSGAHRQIFWRDRLTGETRMISTNEVGQEGDGNSFAPAISADGLSVVFESSAKNLVAGDNNHVRDVFLWSAAGGTIPVGVTRVSVGPAGVEANSESFAPTISGDGKIVAFSTGASNLTPGVSGTSTINVVRRDLTTSLNTLVSANGLGAGVGGDRAMLSEDGNRLVFWTYAADFAPPDTNGLWDIVVYQHNPVSYRRVSLTSTGGERDQGDDSASRVVSPSISGNGRYVAYATTSTNVVPNDKNRLQDVFLVDLDNNLSVRRVSVSSTGQEADGDSPVGQGERVALSYDGRFIAFRSQATNLGAVAGNMFLRDDATGEVRAITNFTYGVATPSLSRGAAYLAFGAAEKLDTRFASTGLFAFFTGIERAFNWID